MQSQKAPEAAPNEPEMRTMIDTFRRWQLHYYQLLYFRGLTKPGPNAAPFCLEVEVKYGFALRMQITTAHYPDYTFGVISLSSEPQEAVDAAILQKVERIQEAIRDGKQRPHPSACCGLAVTTPCVCSYSCKCEIHGGRCVGSHD